jgi:predicted transcriptional regulator
MSNRDQSEFGPNKPFPEEGKFPSYADFQDYVGRSLAELGITAYRLAGEIPKNTNPNFVKNIVTGATKNPTHQSMKRIFDTIERLRSEKKDGHEGDE